MRSTTNVFGKLPERPSLPQFFNSRYIPSGWHHAVFTVPDEHCVALSLNLWYHRPREEPTSTAKDTKVGAVTHSHTPECSDTILPVYDTHLV